MHKRCTYLYLRDYEMDYEFRRRTFWSRKINIYPEKENVDVSGLIEAHLDENNDYFYNSAV